MKRVEQYESLYYLIWYLATNKKAEVWICRNRPIQQVMKHRELNILRVNIDDVYIYSCYFAPTLPTPRICEFDE